MKFADFLQKRIFAPLGMQDTGFWLPKDKASRLAGIYGIDPATGKRTPMPSAPADAPPAFASGGGGLLSTADDYLKFARMLLGQGRSGDTRVLSHESVALMTANWLTPEQRKIPFMGLDFWAGQGFGLGMSIIDDITHPSGFGFASKGSFGWPGAFGTWWQADPKEDMVMIYLVQNAPTLGAGAMATAFRLGQPLAAFQALTYKAIDD
jgi:CubicO group peptidase (beta-lactamase class C family)